MLLQRAQMAAVHRQDHVEVLEVALPHLARALRAEVVAALPRVVLRALVGRLPDVPVAQAGRFDVQLQPCFFAQILRTPSAVGERQMFPVQTNRIERLSFISSPL